MKRTSDGSALLSLVLPIFCRSTPGVEAFIMAGHVHLGTIFHSVEGAFLGAGRPKQTRLIDIFERFCTIDIFVK
jgi:hypothetical protein